MLFYIATFPDSFYVIAGVAVRSFITKLVKKEEQGRMNAFTGGNKMQIKRLFHAKTENISNFIC